MYVAAAVESNKTGSIADRMRVYFGPARSVNQSMRLYKVNDGRLVAVDEGVSRDR